MKRLSFLLIFTLLVFLSINFIMQGKSVNDSEKCVSCHKTEMPGLYNQWAASTHGKNEVTCIDCHGAEESDVDAFKHNDVFVATLVTPKDCSICHEKESEDVSNSYHATAGEIRGRIGSVLNTAYNSAKV